MKQFVLSIVAVLTVATMPVANQTAEAQLLNLREGPVRSAISSVGLARPTQQKPPTRQSFCPSYGRQVPPTQYVPQPQLQYVPQPQYVPQVQAVPYVQSTPVVYSTPTPATPVSASKSRAKQLAAIAKQQFRSKEYYKAKLTLDEIVKLAPNDSSGYQFRGLVVFSIGDFEAAAADSYDTLRLGNTWTRNSVENLYGSNSADYAIQLSKLAESVAQKPSMQGHFLLAYHHMVNEQFEDGKRELQNVLKLEPEEPLTKKLMAVLNQRLAQK
jgi:Tfp pilus assembly protein PilF